MKDWTADLLVGLFGFAATAALVATWPWTALPILVVWVAVNERRIKMQSAANPAPPPVPEGAVNENTQVKRSHDGAQVTIYPASEQRRYDA